MANEPHTPSTRRPQFIEPVFIQDIYISDVADVEELSPNLYRVLFYTSGKCVFDGSTENAISAKLVMSGDTLAKIGITPPANNRPAVRLRLPANN